MAQKEIISVSETIGRLVNRVEVRYTTPNGFHVPPRVRSVNLDSSCFSPEEQLFESCAQPVVDEEALNPHQYTLIKSIYSSNKNCGRGGMISFAGSTGNLRQFSSLDYLLTNLDR
jgi:hypothetical protein